MSSLIGEYDIAVIGGGINGAGIARDAALRGLKVILLEKNDFGSGTTSWSSRLIHGGLRYLEYGEIPLVFESLHERRRLRHVAPHLVDRIRINIPVYQSSRRSKFIINLGMVAYDLLSIGKKIPRHRMLNREELLSEEPGLSADGLIGGAQYYDAQVTFAERLVLENVLSARKAGADVRNYSPVIGINVRQGTVRGLQFVDRTSGQEREVKVAAVINAGGPWVDRVLATVNRELPKFMGGTKGSHIIVGPFNGAPKAAFYVEARSDGRPFFIIPWNQQYLIGTTDIRYDGDPGDVQASKEEIDYLLEETNSVFPQAMLSASDIHFAYAGVRPLPKRDKGPESAITRKHIIFRHKRRARGLISIIGGKLTTYRNLAEQAVDIAAKRLAVSAGDCQTRTLLLPGAEGFAAAKTALLSHPEFSEACATRLLNIYGSRAATFATAKAALRTEDFIDTEKTVLAAEVAFVIQHELAVSLIDIVHRRMMLGLRPDQGEPLAARIAEIAAAEAAWSDAELKRQLSELQTYNEKFSARSHATSYPRE
ncbi:MAG: glycerol-3-phosphate dehydrogenase [Woeseiaceae bacterium]